MALEHVFLYYLYNVLKMLLYVVPLLNLFSFCKNKTRIVNLIWARMSEVGSCKSSLWACTTRSRGFAEKIHQLLVLGNCRIVLTRWVGGSHREMAAGSLEGSWYHNRKGNEAKRIGMKFCISIITMITLFIICTMGIEWPRT